jgi:hypothetical protein
VGRQSAVRARPGPHARDRDSRPVAPAPRIIAAPRRRTGVTVRCGGGAARVVADRPGS